LGYGQQNPLKSSFSAITTGGAGSGASESEKKVLELLDSLEHDQDKFSNNLKVFE
jgi:hypothetical protein